MAMKAYFGTDTTSVIVNGLYQWDRGQVLEIESADFGSEEVEVHFACDNMKEAIVRLCSFTQGVGSVVIPDDCLEQSSTITAWIYEFSKGGTQGKTTKVISLPITARKRPSTMRDVPEEMSNAYTQLISHVNAAIDALETGEVIVSQAHNAESATNATSASNANTANYAVSAGTANNATTVQVVSKLPSINFSAGAENTASLQTIVQLPDGYFPLCIASCSVTLTKGRNASYSLSDSAEGSVGKPQITITATGNASGETADGTYYEAKGSVSVIGLFLRYSTAQ